MAKETRAAMSASDLTAIADRGYFKAKRYWLPKRWA
jgi:hypothetical protein